MTPEDAATLAIGDSVEYTDGRAWRWATVVEPLRDAGTHLGITVRVDTGTYECEALPRELRR